MKATKIPERSRNQVVARDRSRCVRCGSPALPGEWHHRRSRSIRDEDTHASSNGILLCRTCHKWVHEHPFEARGSGWIVSRYANPKAEPIEHALHGRVFLDNDGGITAVSEGESA
jgi:5-methylcytosine-specific restriction endonuclease McrA